LYTTSCEKVAIVGCGYVGSALGSALARVGADVVGTTTSPHRTAELRAIGIRPLVLEHADVRRLHEALADREAVCLTVAPKRRGQDYREVYPAGVRNLLAAVAGTPVRRIIYTSSTRVYGQNDGSWVDERSPTEPADENGRILLEAERALLDGAAAFGGDAHVTASVVRLVGIYGPGRDPTLRIRAAAGTERTDGDANVNLIHVEDIVAALLTLLTVPHHGILNLADDQPEQRRAYYDRVLSRAGLPPIRWASPGGPPVLGKRIRNDAIKRTLNLALRHPTHDL